LTNNLYKPFCAAFLFTGLLTLPFLSFSQQQEEPKRVTVVVTAKEIVSQKEIVQLPADNVPKIVSDKPKEKNTTAKRNITNSSKSLTTRSVVSKAPTAAKKNTVETKKTPVAVAKKEIFPVSRADIAKAKPEVTKETKQTQPSKERIANPIAKVETTAPDVNASKDSDRVTTKLAAEDTIKVTHSTKVNSFSYIWIGIFLIVAGLVLGLLFGKPAFLISFVGIIFIALGLII